MDHSGSDGPNTPKKINLLSPIIYELKNENIPRVRLRVILREPKSLPVEYNHFCLKTISLQISKHAVRF